MRSLKRIAAVAMVALLSSSVTAQNDDVPAKLLEHREGQQLAPQTLAEGPYPRANILEAASTFSPLAVDASNPFHKRHAGCPAGTGPCPNSDSCCKPTQMCADIGGCCNAGFDYTCGTRWCCKYPLCSSTGRCGCRPGYVEVSEDGCCPVGYTVACADDNTCCPTGTICIGGGQCRIGGGVPAPAPPPPPPPPPVRTTTSQAPTPTRGSGGSGDNGGDGSNGGNGGFFGIGNDAEKALSHHALAAVAAIGAVMAAAL
ncbi:hypothetical protein BGW42_002482 [Actinomortierella wolfii]|nr:hypothetical protein BGW42_002482 [Actinomortierella wolfii]